MSYGYELILVRTNRIIVCHCLSAVGNKKDRICVCLEATSCVIHNRWNMRFILLFSFFGHKGVQHLDDNLLPIQHFNRKSKGWKLADVPSLNLLEMLDGKNEQTNIRFFLPYKAMKGRQWLFFNFIYFCCWNWAIDLFVLYFYQELPRSASSC